MKWYNLCVVLVSLMPPPLLYFLLIRNGPPPMSTLVPAWRRHRLKLCWESERDLPCQRSNQQLAQWNTISSLEFSPSCHHVARWWLKAWYLDTRGFIPKKIQWHIHAGPWSLVNWWREVLMRHYIRCSWILMRVAVGLMEWPWPWWWSVYPRDTPTKSMYCYAWRHTVRNLQRWWFTKMSLLSDTGWLKPSCLRTSN